MFPGLHVTLSSDCNAEKTRNVIQECFHMKGAESLPAVKTPTVQRAAELPSAGSASGTQGDGSRRRGGCGGGGRPAAPPRAGAGTGPVMPVTVQTGL